MERDDKKEIIKRTLDNIDIPSINPVAAKVLQLAESDSPSLFDFEKIISKDQAFSLRILKLANSPYYGRGKISQISTAINLIGLDAMKLLVLAVSVEDIYRKHDPFENNLWEHSLGVSIASSLIAAETKRVQPEDALVAGLIHDIGKIVINRNAPETYAEIINMTRDAGYSFVEAENIMLGYDHCSVGGFLARAWSLPENLQMAIEYHHARDLSKLENSDYKDICQTVKIADALCLKSGIGMKRDVNIRDMGIEQAGLTEEMVHRISGDLAANYELQRHQMLD